MAWYAGENANDSHDRGLHLTPQNSAAHAAGQVNNAFVPNDGPGGDYWRMTSGMLLSPGKDSWSVAAWIRPDSAESGYQGFVTVGLFASPPYVTLRSRPELNQIFFGMGDGTTELSVGFESITNDVWSSVIVTLDRSDNMVRCYINNVEATESPTSISAFTNVVTAGEMRIGLGDQSHTSTALIDEVAFWNRVLTPAERAAYHAGITYSDLTQ